MCPCNADIMGAGRLLQNYQLHDASRRDIGQNNTDIMTVEHLLQHCQLHDALRRDVWPEPIPPRVKLCGNLEELRRTAAFVRATGISV